MEKMNLEKQGRNDINIIAGAGGGGGGGTGGGRGGDGGSVHITAGTSHEKITIHDVKSPHRQYWAMLLGHVIRFFKNPIIDLIVILLGAYLIYKFGWNK